MKNTLALLTVLSSTIGAWAHGEDEAKEMGPVAFLWPPDRVWGAAYDNTAPCGSSSGVVNRTEFPLVNGQLALVIQDESWNVQVSISHRNDPASNDDFEAFIVSSRISDIDPGHECYAVPNPGIDVESGMNATFQIKYTSDFDTDKNETYYACADVTYVPASKFTYQVPCFNVTANEFTPTNSSTSDTDNPDSTSASSDTTINTASTKSSGSGLSGGAIAGIVVGCVAAIIIGAVLLFGYRRLLQKYRSARQKASVRNVDWAENGVKPSGLDQPDTYGLRKLK
ncbi:hypothetical protein P175DRAFT_0540894 [Aspergillus ochraceoroseus IBT 24754]|uniref:Copper acquisition factor BIM1-like domain-containing protein n=3 Tax=Aspergillus subgen. Nidulantes TaxID=2720870 RepID=A0A0F8X6F6_9EURO|nr:uncharacterized protein P175DRAFT_0540894 [Aspergillus ochraceoroseus IBT 24754]KKK19162.1 hypothetical protein ARAM_001402 [Aspergillus rambellii]KKK19767.1 hypothetical protein AOCH_003192 [Aspergillus ochraceoroseus]PTU17263.1 hypothetical protein P175DRAFT_0540894 [Aspergillus ochraceoroseus IBT 24754]